MPLFTLTWMLKASQARWRRWKLPQGRNQVDIEIGPRYLSIHISGKEMPADGELLKRVNTSVQPNLEEEGVTSKVEEGAPTRNEPG